MVKTKPMNFFKTMYTTYWIKLLHLSLSPVIYPLLLSYCHPTLQGISHQLRGWSSSLEVPSNPDNSLKTWMDIFAFPCGVHHSLFSTLSSSKAGWWKGSKTAPRQADTGLGFSCASLSVEVVLFTVLSVVDNSTSVSLSHLWQTKQGDTSKDPL